MMLRYVAGTPQEMIDDSGHRSLCGIDEHRPFVTARRPDTAVNKYTHLYGRTPPRVWDRERQQWAERE